MRKGSDLSLEEKERIRTEVASASEGEKIQRREELAAEYNVSLPTIRAITAWTKIRADKMTKQPLSPAEIRRLIHMRIIDEHLQYCAEIKNTPERTSYEVGQIFKKFYTPEEIEAMIEEIGRVGIENMNIPDDLEDPDAKAGERVDYNNEEKNKSREWWLNHLRESSRGEDKSKMKLLLLPAAECHEIDPVIEMGYPPANLRCYNKGDDPAQNGLFIRNCQKRGVYDWHLEDMNDVLPGDNTRIRGGNLDFTGGYCKANERVISYLPVPPNGKMYFTFNFEKKRERTDITAGYRATAHPVPNLILQKKTYLQVSEERNAAYFNKDAMETKEARDKALPAFLHEALGLAREEHWLCKDEMRELIVASQAHPGFDSYDSYQKARAIIETLNTYEDFMIDDLIKMLTKGMSRFSAENIALTLTLMSRAGAFNQACVTKKDIHKYSSATSSPFISVFLECENIHDEYKEMITSIKFYIQALTLYVKGIFNNNTEEVLAVFRKQKCESKLSFRKGGFFMVGDDNVLHFRSGLIMPDNGAFLFRELGPEMCTQISFKQLIEDGQKMTSILPKFGVEILDNDSQQEIARLLKEQMPNAASQITTILQNYAIGERDGKIIIKGKPVTSNKKGVRRNAPCPCGSGKKFKQCCRNNT